MADMLATTSDLAALLGDVDTAKATLLIEGATAVVQAAVGQRLVEATDTVEIIGSCDVWLELPERPVTAVSSVEINGQAVTGWTLYRKRRLWREFGWVLNLDAARWKPSTVEVAYTHGYPAGHQKLQVARQAVLMLAAQEYSNPTGLIGVRIDDYSEQYSQAATGAASVALPDHVRGLLQRAYGTGRGSVALR